MAYKSRSAYKTDTTNIKSLNLADGKIDAVELTQQLDNIADSVGWEFRKYTMSSNTYDAANGNLQERILTSNGTLTITGCEAGKYYTLIKKGAYTLTLPTGADSASGSVTGTGKTVITFLYDGTDYYFSFNTYYTVI